MGGENANTEMELESLRGILSGTGDHALLDLFDEFMAQREFGLALHVVCDFILDSKSLVISDSVISDIERLHKNMDLEDTCVEELRSQQSTRKPS